MSLASQAVTTILDELSTVGWSAPRDFLPGEVCRQLTAEIIALRSAGTFGAGGVGQGESWHVDPAIRGDTIHWLDEHHLSQPQLLAWQALEALRQTLNRTLFLGLRDLEAHLTCYPPGSHYAKHVDNFRGTSARLVSCVLYLNSAWSPTDGGELQIYTPSQFDQPETLVAEIAPRSGTLACFLSEEVPHAVKVTRTERLSLTAWFRR